MPLAGQTRRDLGRIPPIPIIFINLRYSLLYNNRQIMKHILLLLLGLFVSSVLINAEAITPQAKIDSLLAELPNAKGDTNEIKLLINLGSTISLLNPIEGISYSMKGLALAKKLNLKGFEAACYNNLGKNYKWNSDYAKAIEYYKKALTINEILMHKSGIANSLASIGGVYLEQSNYPKSLEYYQYALELNEELGNKSEIAHIYGNIGIIYRLQSNSKKAIYFYKKSLELHTELREEYGIIKNLRNIGGLYLQKKDYSKALEFFDRSLKLSEKLGDKNGVAMSLGSIGIIYTDLSDYTKALDSYNEALKLNKEIGKKRGIAYDYLSLGILYYKLSQEVDPTDEHKESKYNSLDNEINLNKSIGYLHEAEELYKKMNNLNELSRTYDALHNAYYQKGDFKSSVDAHRNFKNLQDSIFSFENTNKILALEKAREDDLKQKEIETQKIKIAEQEKREQMIMYFSIGIVLFMTLVMIVIFRLLKRSDKLLYNVLPVSIAKRLKKKEHPISDYFTQASIVFIDIVNFTEIASNSDPQTLVSDLNMIFTKYDSISKKYGLEKIKTIGDSYMAAAGIPEVQKDNTYRAAQMALEVKELMEDYHTANGTKIDVRIGLDCGPVVAGVIGENKFIYDMWSDAVNTASRMESSSIAGQVQVSERFKIAVTKFEEFEYIERGEIDIKGKGKMKTYFIGSKTLETV